MYLSYIIFIVITIASYLVQRSLTSKFEKYSRVPLNGPMTGAQVAMMMLGQNGINDVQVTATSGTLTDFFDPTRKTVNLSDPVYGTLFHLSSDSKIQGIAAGQYASIYDNDAHLMVASGMIV